MRIALASNMLATTRGSDNDPYATPRRTFRAFENRDLLLKQQESYGFDCAQTANPCCRRNINHTNNTNTSRSREQHKTIQKRLENCRTRTQRAHKYGKSRGRRAERAPCRATQTGTTSNANTENNQTKPPCCAAKQQHVRIAHKKQSNGSKQNNTKRNHLVAPLMPHR